MTGNHPEKSKGGRTSGSFAIKALTLFLVIVGGLVTGAFVTDKLGLTDLLLTRPVSAENFRNESLIKVDERCPDFDVIIADDDRRPLAQVLRGRETLIAFLSNGCDPCHRFLDYLKRDDPENKLNVIGLSLDPEALYNSTNIPLYEVDGETLTQLDVFAFPTIVKIDAEGRVVYVSSGFSSRTGRQILGSL